MTCAPVSGPSPHLSSFDSKMFNLHLLGLSVLILLQAVYPAWFPTVLSVFHKLHTRQAIEPGDIPPQCRDQCAVMVEAVNTCVNDACLCDPTVNIGIASCYSCLIVLLHPDAASIQEAQGDLAEYEDLCNSEGFHLPSLTVSGFTPAPSPSSTVKTGATPPPLPPSNVTTTMITYTPSVSSPISPGTPPPSTPTRSESPIGARPPSSPPVGNSSPAPSLSPTRSPPPVVSHGPQTTISAPPGFGGARRDASGVLMGVPVALALVFGAMFAVL